MSTSTHTHTHTHTHAHALSPSLSLSLALSLLFQWLSVLVVSLQWGVLIVCVEWMVFSSTHNKGSKWKESFGQAPFWVKAVMDNGTCHLQFLDVRVPSKG